MKTDWLKITIIGYLLFSIVGCNPVASPAVPNETPIVPALPRGDSTPMNPNSPTPAASGLENLIEKAREDLAQRLAVSTNQIGLVEATEVEWSNSSLDCPQPDMSYLEVITPGYRILLEANGQTYEYHSNREAYVIYCENLTPPILPKP